MTTERYVAGSGQGLTWGNAVTGSVLNGLGSNASVLSDISIDNSSNLDMFADLSLHLASATFAALSGFNLFVYPLNQDGSTYGDGRFGSASAGTPNIQYFAGKISFVAGTSTQNGVICGIILPPGIFKFVFSALGATWASSGNTAFYRTYNRSVA